MNILKKQIPLRYLYLIGVLVLILISLGLYVTYAMFTADINDDKVLSIESNVTYDFGIPEANKVTPTAKWNNATSADPIKDIVGWQDQIENSTGIRPNMLLMNGTTFNLMQNAEKVQKAIYAFANNVVTPTRADVLAYVEKATQCRVLVYNKGYNKDGETTLTKFVGDGVVVLFPEGTVGEFVYGTTPEESDLMSGATSAVVEVVDDGIAITGTKLTDPVNVETKVSMIALPTLDLPESIIIADVDGE